MCKLTLALTEIRLLEECTYLCEDNMDDVKNRVLLWDKIRKL